MSQYLVAVVDGSQARFFTLSPAAFDANEAGPNLIEQDPLHNAQRPLGASSQL